MLSRIRVTGKAKKRRRKKQQQAATAAAEKAVPGSDESCPSNYDIFDSHAAGNADIMESDDDDEGTSGGAQSDIVHQGDDGNDGGGGVVGEMTGGYYTKFLFIKILLCCLSK